MKHLIMLVLCVLLTLDTLDTIYVGVYTDGERDELIEIEPETYEYELCLDLESNQEAYYFYNLGFGRLSPTSATE